MTSNHKIIIIIRYENLISYKCVQIISIRYKYPIPNKCVQKSLKKHFKEK